MMYNFDVISNKSLKVTAATAIQAVGRLCTLTPDVDHIPTITLWTPKRCWTFINHWMDLMDSLPVMYREGAKHPEKTIDEVRMDMLRTKPDEVEALSRHFAAPTGENKKGDALHASIDHQRVLAKRAYEDASSVANVNGKRPCPVIQNARKEEDEMRLQNLNKTIAKVCDASPMDEESSNEEEGEGEGSNDDEFASSDRATTSNGVTPHVLKSKFRHTHRQAKLNIKNLRVMYRATVDDAEQNDLLMQLWIQFYIVFILRKGHNHGVCHVSTVNDYIVRTKQCINDGKDVWKTLADLPPVVKDPKLVAQSVDRWNDTRNTSDNSRDHRSHMKKAIDFFPAHLNSVEGVREFLLKHSFE